MKGTQSRKHYWRHADTYKFYLSNNMALDLWESSTMEGLKQGLLSEATINLVYADDRIPTAVGTYRELLQKTPEYRYLLKTTVLVTEVARLYAAFEDMFGEFCRYALTQISEPEEWASKNSRTFQTILDTLRTKIGLDITNTPPAVQVEIVREIVETRNRLVHNNGSVDQKYLNTFPASTLTIGDQRPLSSRYLQDSLITMSKFMHYYDMKVAECIESKTGVQMPEYPDCDFSNPPLKGEAFEMVRCWIVALPPVQDPNNFLPTSIVEWARRGNLETGEIIAFCKMKKADFDCLSSQHKFVCLPVIGFPSDMSNVLKWLEGKSVAVREWSTSLEIIQEVFKREGRDTTELERDWLQYRTVAGLSS